MNAVSILPVLLRPKSRGKVRLQSSNPWEPPLVDPKYLTDREDLDLIVEAIEATVHMVNSSKRLLQHNFQVKEHSNATVHMEEHNFQFLKTSFESWLLLELITVYYCFLFVFLF
jgi:choline dehydrogenase-like flavoprotein